MDKWTIDDAEDLYRIQRWSDGYFGIGEDGKLLALPNVGRQEVPIALQDVIDELRAQNVQFPVVMRFHDILKNRVRQLNEAFASAIDSSRVSSGVSRCVSDQSQSDAVSGRRNRRGWPTVSLWAGGGLEG